MSTPENDPAGGLAAHGLGNYSHATVQHGYGRYALIMSRCVRRDENA